MGVSASGLGGDCIVVEITEGLLLSTSDGVVEQLLAMSDDGIAVSLDDFEHIRGNLIQTAAPPDGSI